MKKLNIEITNAKILSYKVDFENEDEQEPIVTVTIGLFTAGGKKITTYTIANKKYYGSGEAFVLPTTAAAPILGVAQVLETVVTKACRDAQKLIAEKVGAVIDAEDDEMPF